MAGHNKPSTAAGWRHDDDVTTVDPRWTAPCLFVPGRFVWTQNITSDPEGDMFVVIYLPWGTDVRIGTATPADGDQIRVTSFANLVWQVRAIRPYRADTPEQELQVVCEWVQTLGFPLT